MKTQNLVLSDSVAYFLPFHSIYKRRSIISCFTESSLKTFPLVQAHIRAQDDTMKLQRRLTCHLSVPNFTLQAIELNVSMLNTTGFFLSDVNTLPFDLDRKPVPKVLITAAAI